MYRIFARGIFTALFVVTMVTSTVTGQFPSDYLFGDHLTGTDFTIAGWFNASVAQTTDAAIISNKNWGSGSNPGFVLTADARGSGTGHQWKVNANGVGGTRADTDWTDFSLNQWTFIAATFSRNGNLTAYTNGGSLAGGSTSIRTSPLGLMDTAGAPNYFDFNIGQDGTGNYDNGQGFIGRIDDMAVWRRALSDTEIAGLYNQGISNNSLGSLFGTSLNGGMNLIDLGLVGYYGFENNLNDGAGTPQNGIARLSGGAPGSVAYNTGRFGQALELNGGNYVTIGDAVPPADATFTGNSPTNNLASNPANWDLNPALLTPGQGIIVASGTSAVFSGPNTGPAVFTGSFPVTQIKNVTFGGTGQTTFIEFSGTGAAAANIIGVGADSRIGVTNSTVNLSMSGDSRLEHRGSDEEAEEMLVGQGGSNVTITMTNQSEITSGPKVADASYATGFRRPVSTDPPGTPPRTGDDLKLGVGSVDNPSQVNVTMNDHSLMFIPDVLYPMDGQAGTLNVVQNGNSQVIANWDTRFLDTGGHTSNAIVNWTMNGNSKFKVARDHGLGEQPGNGSATVNVNDSAEFFAGDRIVIGAGGGNAVVNINGPNALMKVGGNSPSDILLVDETGEVAPGTEPQAIDWILHMGGNANARLNVNGGRVEIGRSAYVGRGGGTAEVQMKGGTFQVKGVGPIGVGLGNSPDISVPGNVNWQTNGGDLIIAYDQGDVASFSYAGGNLSVARDLIVSFDNDFNGTGGDGTLRMVSHNVVGSSVTVGRDLSFSGDAFSASGSPATLDVVFKGDTLTPISVAGDLLVYNSGTSTSEITVSRGLGGLAPQVGQYVIIDYAGTRIGDTFTKVPAPGITYDVIYDAANTRVLLDIQAVTLIDPDFNHDRLLNCQDVDSLVGVIAAGTNVAAFDLNGDGSVNTADLNLWLAEAGAYNLSSGNPYRQGDANLDGVVDGSDFGVWNANKFTSTARWCAGDFTADGVVDGSDFGLWNANKFTSSDSISAVPEPGTLGPLLCLLGLLVRSYRLFRRQ